jgi:Fe-S-cluster containining protein
MAFQQVSVAMRGRGGISLKPRGYSITLSCQENSLVDGNVMAKSKKKDPFGHIRRLTFPEDEKFHDWLSMLLDAYHITDRGVAEGIALMTRQGHRLACAKGCSHCCVTHRSIPTYPMELVGLTWYATEKLTGAVREDLKTSLREHKPGDPCAFLIKGVCAIHPMRPMACRQFNVFNTACGPGEDAYYTRREDVMTPNRKYADEAFFIMLPFYGVKNKAERRRVVKEGAQHAMAKDMQSLNWISLANKMLEFEVRQKK